MTNTSKNIVFSCAFFALGLAITLKTFDYSDQSAVFLRGLSLTLSLMALAYLATNMLKRRATDSTEPTPPQRTSWTSNHGNALLVFLLVGCYIALMQVVGFFLSTVAFGYITQLAISRHHRMLYVIYAVLMSATIYLIFFKILGIAVPESHLSLDQFLKLL